MDKINIDLWGSCTIRDVFEFHVPLKTKYNVSHFIQCNPPTVCGYSKLSETSGLHFGLSDFTKTSNAWDKWFQLNAEQNAVEYLNNNKSRYLIVNLTDLQTGT